MLSAGVLLLSISSGRAESSGFLAPKRGGCSLSVNVDGRIEEMLTTDFLDESPSTDCKDGFCQPPSCSKAGSMFYTDAEGARSVASNVCKDVLPPGFNAVNASQAAERCLELAAVKACEKEEFQNGTYCALTCGICTMPIWADGATGAYSNVDQLLSNGLFNSTRFLPKMARKKCEKYDVMAVVKAIKDWAATNPPNFDIPRLNRAAFHDAADYNKWTGQGGPDGNLVMGQEAFYGQSHGLPMVVKSSLAQFKTQFGEKLSWADLLQIAGMVATEIAGGPKFEEYGFVPGRIDNPTTASLDGLLPNAGDLANMNTNRDFWFRAGFDDHEIVASMGAHTLGGAFTGDFTSTPDEFNNQYYKNLLKYEEPACCVRTVVNGFTQLPTDRALLTEASTRKLVELYAANQTAWFKDYVKAIHKMSLFGQDTSVKWCDYD
eukprot:TRINITY_DN12079_c0_g1_i1.p1 TRINITY_DN12079_c0_g1~~TRINITY_DN12079_c0_g1_i1.p1  ORF type:complete len:434 (-),score=106.60 TRINITY_DN12079_c0_g1_i1:286-1587(-)